MSDPKVERVIAMAERLIEALKADIAALERGTPSQMRSTDPEIQQLSLLYGREAAGLNAKTVKATAPAQTYAKLMKVTKHLQEILALHARIITRVKNASEGMIRAIAEEVDRRRLAARPYAAKPSYAPRPAAAMIYNSVV
jgi:hypothetical protein